MRRKKRIITTLTLVSAIIIMTVLPLPKVEAASFTVSKSNVSIENGKNSTITINAPTHTGRLDIVSSNSSVAVVSENSLWVENNSKTITISAKNVGNAIITIKGELFDASTEEESTFSKTINVTVTKVATSGSTNTGNSSNGTQSGGTSSGNQSGSGSNTGTSSSGGQSSSNTNKPSSGSTSSTSNSNSQTSKPSNSNSTTIKPSNSSSANTNKTEQTVPVIEQETTEEIINTEENIIQEEIQSEEVEELTQESITIEDSDNVEIENVQEAKFFNPKGKIVIVSIIGGIALAMILIGIGISKNIFKK